MTIYDYVLAQVDARERAEERATSGFSPTNEAEKQEVASSISIAGDLGVRAYTQRDARRKWARAA